MRSTRKLLMVGTIAAGLLPGLAFAELGEPAGVAGAVSGAVGIVSPAKQISTPVAVNSGDGIVMGDGLSTGSDSRLQVMLLDESAITLGPDAQITIDEFVYDPANTNSNAMSASIAKGAFRLVTGGIARQNPEGTEVKLPNAVLTIRGTTVIGACAATCFVALAGTGDENTAGKKPSVVTLKSDKGTVVLKRTGYYVEIGADGTLSPPRKMTDEIDKKFADLFVPLNAAGAPVGGFQPDPRQVIGQSGQPTQEANPLAVNQREFEDAGQINGTDTLQTTSNLPVAQIQYASDAISFTGGSGDGVYFTSFTLDMGARATTGSLTIDHQDEGFVTTIALPSASFDQGLSLTASGSVPGALLASAPNPDATFNLNYTIGHDAVGTSFQFDSDGTGTAFGPSTGSGDAPLVP